MEDFWKLYHSDKWLDFILPLSIYTFMTITVALFLLIMFIRSEKIIRRKNYVRHSLLIEAIFMSVIFSERTYASIKEDTEYSVYLRRRNFRKQMMKSIINLHQNYEGSPALVLENFYYESGLLRDSFGKLKSNKPEIVCRGMRELAEMKINKAFLALAKLARSKNREVKITAITACARLNPNRGILLLTQHKDPIDRWEQLNIINGFKRNYAEENEEAELLLVSGNTTVVSLGLKIIHTLELARKVPYVASLIENAPDDAIKQEAEQLLHFLTTKTSSDDWY